MQAVITPLPARTARPAVVLLAALLLGGCALLAGAGGPRPDTAALDRDAAMFYVTDRAPREASTRRTLYGFERSASMAFGTVSVPADTGPRRQAATARELTRFPRTPLPFSQQGGRIIPDRQSQRAYAVQSDAFKTRVAAALRAAGTREVVLFVHGFNNSFAQGAASLASVWQAGGRTGVPLLFSWPAGHPGLFGYFMDRESGEFAIFHFKETMRLLAQVPGLRAIHVVAHSRGADVATTGLREMVIAARAAGRIPRDVLKVDNLILAAPDMDFQIVRQRLIAEAFGPAFGRISVYMNPGDNALGLAQMLMSGTRFGRLSFDGMAAPEKEIFSRIKNVDFISVANVVRRSGHGYFRQNPAVLSDIGALLRRSAGPRSPRRNLQPDRVNFWTLTNTPPPGLARDAPREQRG